MDCPSLYHMPEMGTIRLTVKKLLNPAIQSPCKCKQLTEFRDAMLTLGITGDSLFDRIRDDLARGLVNEARTHLNFVDVILKELA